MDSFFGIGLFELVMIAVVALLVLGPERLPGTMREVAKWMRQLRNLSSEFQSQFSEEFKMLDEINPRRIINEALDPNAQPKPPAQAAQQPAKPAAKPLAAPKPVAPAVKPAAAPAAARVNAAPAAGAAAASAGVAVSGTNGEPQNTILPPAKAAAAAVAEAAEVDVDAAEATAHAAPVASPEENPPAGYESGPASNPTPAGADSSAATEPEAAQ
jgi:sec-independent protein translocase protein TatB